MLPPFKRPQFITLYSWCTFQGIHMTILWRVLAHLKYKGCIEAFNYCNTEESFITSFTYESYDSSQAPLVSCSSIRHKEKEIRSAKTEDQITKWIQCQYFKIVFLLLFSPQLQVLRKLTQFKKYIYEHF